MKNPGSSQIVAEKTMDGHKVRVIEEPDGGYHLQKISLDGQKVLSSEPIYGDLSVLSEAREHFPDLFPFGALPVDAT